MRSHARVALPTDLRASICVPRPYSRVLRRREGEASVQYLPQSTYVMTASKDGSYTVSETVRPHLRRDLGSPLPHICAGTGLESALPTSALGLGLAPSTSESGLGSPCPPGLTPVRDGPLRSCWA